MSLESSHIVLIVLSMILGCRYCREHNRFLIFLEVIEDFDWIVRSQVAMLLMGLQLM